MRNVDRTCMHLKKFQEKVEELIPAGKSSENIEIWFQDEARIGLRGTVTRIWATKGTRPRVIRQQ